MYANLEITTPNGKKLFAYKVEHGPNGTDVFLDRQDGSGSYYEEGGKLHFHPNTKLTIAASF